MTTAISFVLFPQATVSGWILKWKYHAQGDFFFRFSNGKLGLEFGYNIKNLIRKVPFFIEMILEYRILRDFQKICHHFPAQYFHYSTMLSLCQERLFLLK